MKGKEKKFKFIELRAKGLSYDKISEELNVSKPTLLQWKSQLQRELANAEFTEMQSFLEQFKLSAKIKIETMSKKLIDVYSMIEKHDISKLHLKDLLMFKKYLENELEHEKMHFRYYSAEYAEIEDTIYNEEDVEIEEIILHLE